MRITLSIYFILIASFLIAQQTVTVNLEGRHQTIQGFGASDAWNFDPVGKHWNTDIKEDIAELLFSTEIDGNNPSGIGLSRWRFNIGGGSTEQGEASNISQEERRSECFISSIDGNGDAVYDWNKQSGQQWFLNKANDYGVHQLVAFVNSPPRFYTKNGRTNSDNSNRYGTTNLGDSNYNKFSDFLVTVLKHFSDEGIEFDQISPINEPQYPWNSNQEGCPWKHDEVYKLVDKLNRDILAENLDTKILLSEAADYRYLTGVKDDSDKSDIIDNYFDPNSEYFMGDFSQMLPGIGAHSYWINGSDANMSSIRQDVRDKMDAYPGLEVYQTEYNLLNRHFDDKLENAIFLAKLIYTDLEIVGVSMWDYWTAIERERWSQKNRFYLLRLIPGGGNYASLENTGSINVDKNLWALGNFSRFIRPGYQRVETSGANDLAGLMAVSFIAPDNSELVTVYVNWSDDAKSINQNLTNLPNGLTAEMAQVFTTDVNNDLTKGSDHSLNNSYSIPSKSIVTFRIPLSTEDCASLPTLNVTTNRPITCSRIGGIAVTDDENYEYLWSNGVTDRFIESNTPGEYSVSITDENECTNTRSITLVDERIIPPLTVINNSPITCENSGQIDVTIRTDYSYLWSNGSTNYFIETETGGDYTVTVTDANGCKNSLTEVLEDNTTDDILNGLTSIEAEDYCSMLGIQTEIISGVNENIGYIESGDYTVYSNVDFGSTVVNKFSVLAASKTSGGTVEVHLDSPSGPLVTSVGINGTGAWDNYQEFETTEEFSLTGVHDVYLVYTDGLGYLFNLDSYLFKSEIITGNAYFIVNEVDVYPNPFSSVISISNPLFDLQKVEVLNATGDVIFSKSNIFQSSLDLNLANEFAGIYILKMITNKGTITRKLIKN